jgi:hypothetical protein
MKQARQAPAADRRDEAERPWTSAGAHAPRTVAERPWWIVGPGVVVAIVLAVCIRDAIAWVGRPFPGFLFSDGGIIYSIGRSEWRPASLRRLEWTHIDAVNGTPNPSPAAIRDAVDAAGVGGTVTYTLRRNGDVFRLAVPVRVFAWRDFAEVFAPMLVVGTWLVAVGIALVAVRPRASEIRALFAVCLPLGLVLITGPDTYGPYRFTWLFFLSLAALPPAVLHLAAAFLWRRGRWGPRIVGAVYVLFAIVGAALAGCRGVPAVFLPLLYLVYCALANALLVYAGSLVSALVSGERFRPQVVAALIAILASGSIVISVFVTYPLRTEPVSVPWLILPLGLWPVLHGVAFVKLEGERRGTAP